MADRFDAPSSGLLARLHDAQELYGPIGLIGGAMFFVKDATYRYVAMSPAIRAAIGLGERESPLGRTLLDEVHVVGTRGGFTKLTYSSKWPLRDRADRIVGLVGINRPHTQRMPSMT